METVGFLELNSIARGIEAADTMLKAAQTRLVLARAGCPGKYYILITGDVSAVESAMEAGVQTGGCHVVDSTLIPRVHPGVVRAIEAASLPPPPGSALGVMEFFSVSASIQAADAAVKAADVVLLEVRLGMGIGGKSFVVLAGDTAAVQESVRCGAAAAQESGMLLETVVIPHPRPEITESLL